MNIQRVPIDQVEPWEKNPRGIKTKDYERLKKQITKLGVYKPLVAYRENGKYVVLGGNMRIRALKEMGLKEVDVSVVEAKTEAKKIEYALSDNDRAGFYEEDKLAELVYPHIKDLDLGEFKVDLGEPWIDIKRIIERYGPNIDSNKEWEGMPEFDNPNHCYKKIIVNFGNEEDIRDFFSKIGQDYTDSTKSIWFPRHERRDLEGMRFDGKD